jgi:hypothetical protein
MTGRPHTPRAGLDRRIALLVLFPALALLCCSAAFGWGEAAHRAVITTAFSQLLPPPLSTWFARNEKLVAAASNGPDIRKDVLTADIDRLNKAAGQAADRKPFDDKVKELEQQLAAQRSQHYFDLDALTDAAPPYADFPRDQAAAGRAAAKYLLRADRPTAAKVLKVKIDELPEKPSDEDLDRLGRAALEEFGTLPWVLRDQVKLLTETFRERKVNKLPEVIGDLAHYVTDLHQPLHTTKNFGGQGMPHDGIHRAIEIDLMNRFSTYYNPTTDLDQRRAHLVRYDQQKYPLDVLDLVFRRVAANAPLVKAIMDADTAARNESHVTESDLKWLNNEKELPRDKRDALITTTDVSKLDEQGQRIVKYVEALQKQVTAESFGGGPRRWMDESSSMLAALVYSAWADAGRPPLEPPPTEAEAPRPPIADWLLFLPGVILLGLLLAVILSRRPKPPSADDLD